MRSGAAPNHFGADNCLHRVHPQALEQVIADHYLERRVRGDFRAGLQIGKHSGIKSFGRQRLGRCFESAVTVGYVHVERLVWIDQFYTGQG